MNRILLIDDETPENLDAVKTLLSSVLEQEIIILHPYQFNELDVISEGAEKGDLDGAIIDLRLDQIVNKAGEKANYRGITLANEIRSRQMSDDIKGIPLFLLTTADKIKNYEQSIDSLINLFDFYFKKDNLPDDHQKVASIIQSIIHAYKNLSKEKDQCLGGEVKRIGVHSEITDVIGGKMPKHQRVQFILRELILKSGPLISESVLAARLGVDFKNSDDWSNLKKTFLLECGYSGLFSSHWNRWWSELIQKWWDQISEIKTPLQLATASERVEIIKNSTGLDNLNPIEKGENNSTKFWAVCKKLEIAIDPIEGFRSNQTNNYLWQEQEYYSLQALREFHEELIPFIHPLERTMAWDALNG